MQRCRCRTILETCFSHCTFMEGKRSNKVQLYQNWLSHFSRSAPTKLWFVLQAKNINCNQLPPITEGTLVTRFWTA